MTELFFFFLTFVCIFPWSSYKVLNQWYFVKAEPKGQRMKECQTFSPFSLLCGVPALCLCWTVQFLLNCSSANTWKKTKCYIHVYQSHCVAVEQQSWWSHWHVCHCRPHRWQRPSLRSRERHVKWWKQKTAAWWVKVTADQHLLCSRDNIVL